MLFFMGLNKEGTCCGDIVDVLAAAQLKVSNNKKYKGPKRRIGTEIVTVRKWLSVRYRVYRPKEYSKKEQKQKRVEIPEDWKAWYPRYSKANELLMRRL